MIKELRNIKTGKTEIRQFAFIIVTVLLMISATFFWIGKEGSEVFFVLGVLIAITGIIFPKVLKLIYVPWMLFAGALAWLMTRVILCLIFYLVLTPIGLLSRLFGKRFLELKLDVSKQSYWNYTKKIKTTQRDHERQF